MHPVHALGPYNSSHQARLPNADFMTPANQRHLVDLHAPNGSASTVELASNPPSSAAAPSTVLPEHLQSRLPIESPSLPSKRLPLSGEPSKLDNVLISSPIPHRTPAPALASSIDRPGSGHPTEMYENSTFEPPAATFGPAQADGLTATDRDEVEHLVRTPLPQAGVTALL
ncbi:hypothetical protein M501DRAFT_249278 [Patellaria atrata CBS 101060]|uniref:Uncharacterized protein n=1 Tax=Patellaria atrata CBS 101060 TaxID=1346257 RepID=A0A9P4VPB5_9PEZI|nr:hypothetical protein M501DRAFT_249278 [Patellaria atrata CBS 101060]